MAALKKSTKAKAPGVVAAKSAAKKTASEPSRRAADYRRTFRRVAVATVGGFKVFGSPVQPAHRTALQIEEAVAQFN